MKKFRVFCVVGKSGSGKGTQDELMKKKLGKTHHIVNGDLFRAFMKSTHPLAPRIGKIVNSGDLPPAWFSAFLWETELIKFVDPKAKTAIFEGTPRRVWEAELLDEISEFMFGSKPLAIHLDISDQEAKRRLLVRLVCKRCQQPMPYQLLAVKPKKCPACGGPVEKRKDDNPKAILNRLRFFRHDVLPALRYYQQQKRLIRVNGEQSAQAVFAELWSKLSHKIH